MHEISNYPDKTEAMVPKNLSARSFVAARPCLSGVSVLLLSFLIMSVMLSACTRSDEKSVSVDFGKRVQVRDGFNGEDVQPLRIAIAALVSPKETDLYYHEMMKYVSKRLGRKIDLIQRKTYAEVNDMLEKKELDLAFVCSGPYVKGKEKFGMELLAAPMLYGKPFYQAYFIVHKDSQINDIRGLRGKRFAFTDPYSNTGRLVPTFILSRMNETPKDFFSEFIFTYSHDNSIKAVSKGIVDGASVDGLIWDYYHERSPEFVGDTKIIYRSPLYGIPPVVVHPETPPPLKENLKRIFLGMHEEPEGKKILSKIRIERFIVPEDSSYESVRDMQKWIEGEK